MAGATLTRPPAWTPEVSPMSVHESTLGPAREASHVTIQRQTAMLSVAAVADEYLNDPSVRRRLAPRTIDLRRQQLGTHVVPLLGPATPLGAVSTRDIRLMVRALERSGL